MYPVLYRILPIQISSQKLPSFSENDCHFLYKLQVKKLIKVFSAWSSITQAANLAHFLTFQFPS